MEKVDLQGGWTELLSALGLPSGLWVVLTVVGVLIVVLAIFKMLWDRRRGGGGGLSGIMMPLAIGGFLAAPRVVVPLLLWFADLLLNSVIQLLNRAKGG